MANRGTSGSSVVINNEIHFKGEKTEVRSNGKSCAPVDRSEIAEPVNANAFVAKLLGGIPNGTGTQNTSAGGLQMLGGIAAAGMVEVAQNPQTLTWMLNYVLSLLKVVDGAYAKNGVLSEEELRKLIASILAQMLESAGPAFANWNQVLADAMQQETLNGFLKGVQPVICALTGDPVNANTGNFIYEKEDLTIQGKSPLSFRRFYNRIDTRVGCMGKGWRHNYEIQLLIESDRYVILWDDGREEVYLRDENNKPIPLFGGFCRLQPDGKGYLYETQSKLLYAFDEAGALVKQSSPNGQWVQLLYDKYNRLNCVINNYGSSLHYAYDDNSGMLTQVTDHTGREVTLKYELGRLKEVKNAAGASYQYFYDKDKNICRICNPRRICVLENQYDGKGRTAKQTFADGGVITYDYQENLSRTLVTEQNGNRIAYVHDDRYRNIKTIYADGEETFCYNEHNQLVWKTDKKNNKTIFAYDDKGNTAQIIYPDGAKHNMTYDGNNRLLVLSINGAERLKNAYDANGNLVKTTDALGQYREIEYDTDGKAVKLTQPNGSSLLMEYDRCGNIIQIIDGMGNRTAYEYDDCNRVIRTCDGNRNLTQYAYNAVNQITCVTNAAGNSKTYEYTPNGKVAKVVDFNGAVSMWKYNPMNQVEAHTLPDGGTICMEYDVMQNVTRRTLPNGAEIAYAYDARNRMEEMRLPTGGSFHYEYDQNGNRTAVIDPEGNRTTLEYDERDRVIRETDPSGASTEYEYSMDGYLTCITNAQGKSHIYVYNEVGQIIKETDILGNSTCYEYNKMGKVSCITDSKKRKTVYEYAPGGILSKIIYPDSRFEEYFYDSNGNLTRRQNQKGDYLELTYDCLNRITAVSSSFGQEKRYTYDAMGKVASVADALGNMTQYTYSPGGKLTSVVDAAGNRTEYAYDATGGLVTICQHEGDKILLTDNGRLDNMVSWDENRIHITRYERNQLGKIETITNPLGLQEHYAYNPAGRLILKKDRDGYETHYNYNPVGDIERVSYDDGRSVLFSYNELRQLTEVQDWLGTTKIELDDAGRAKKIVDHRGRAISYRWSAVGEREALIYPDGSAVKYEYDELSRLSRLTEGDKEVLYHYDQDGRLSDKIFPNDVASSYKYNSMGLLCTLVHSDKGQVLEQYDYEYDHMGNKTAVHKLRKLGELSISTPRGLGQQMQEENGYYQYQYDSLNRLTAVRKDRRNLHRYVYDAFGNRVWKKTENGDTRYYYNAANQLIRTDGASQESFQYDARGNLTAIVKGNRTVQQYLYDATNRMASAMNAIGVAARYQYDGLGNRIGVQEYAVQMKSENLKGYDLAEAVLDENPAREADYLIDMTKQYHNLLSKTETADGKTTNQSYVWDSNAVFMTEGESSHIYLQDELGSVVRLIGMQKDCQMIYGYDEFGQDLYGTQGEIQPFGYTGYRKDKVANTYFAQAREYMPQLGRFVEEDILKGRLVDSVSLNTYGYCYGNPIGWLDLDGYQPQKSPLYIPNTSIRNTDENEIDEFCRRTGYKRAENYIPNTSIGNTPYVELDEYCQRTGYERAKNYISNTSMGVLAPDAKIHYLEPEDDKIVDLTITVGNGVYAKGKVGNVGIEAGAKKVYIFNSLDATQWKEALNIGASVSAGPIFNGEIGYNAEKVTYFDHFTENGATMNGSILQFQQNESGDYILNVLDFGGYLVIGGEVKVDINVTKALDALVGNGSSGCPLSETQK